MLESNIIVLLNLSSEPQSEIILLPEVDEVDINTSNENIDIQPSSENMKANTPELEKKNILDRVSRTIAILAIVKLMYKIVYSQQCSINLNNVLYMYYTYNVQSTPD